MKQIEFGTCFNIPLGNEEFAFGYVVFDGDFVIANVFDFKSTNEKDFELAFTKPLLIKEWLTDIIVFSGTNWGRRYPKWKLYRKLKFSGATIPLEPFVIFGGPPASSYRRLNYITDEIELATDDDVKKYQRFITRVGDYYTAFVNLKFSGIEFDAIRYDSDSSQYVPVVPS